MSPVSMSDNSRMLGFKRLDVYKCSIELLSLTMQVVVGMADTKNSGALAEQLRRAALSIPLNIAEGAGRRGRADQAKFYVIARGSAMECAAIFDAARAMGMIDEAVAGRADELVTRIVEMLTRMCHFRD